MAGGASGQLALPFHPSGTVVPAPAAFVAVLAGFSLPFSSSSHDFLSPVGVGLTRCRAEAVVDVGRIAQMLYSKQTI